MTDKLIEIVGRAIEAADTLDRDKLARAALAAINLPARLDEEYSRGWSDATQSATTALQAFDAASYTQGWNEAIEAAADWFADRFSDAVQADCESGVKWLNERAAKAYLKDAPDTLAAIREGEEAIRALSVPAIVEAGDGGN